ncbi:MAG: sigma 54-interacting transcriptional regulator [Clostridiales bacterium]|nr:sigma 54-interacting transcriptional regulator [Clostridiales bacterium]
MSKRREDRILEFVFQHADEGVTAQQTAGDLGIWRNDASVELNKLVEKGLLRREGKKNVRFFPAESGTPEPDAEGTAVRAPECSSANAKSAANEDAFSKLVGSNGSLKHLISIAKAAVSYPPSGLNMLITGPTGIGKTTFARTVWEYANEIHAFGCNDREVPFVHFNCAEYADNPQLLLSILFGSKKGAFTGSIADRPGLVEEADGGIFFLDEIHCLSGTSQELFFTLLDTGYFRRVGENTKRETHFMLIGATTKPISNTTLIDTFVRRMPVLLQLPTLSERPMREWPEFIRSFYAQEAKHIDRAICVKRDVLNTLVGYAARINLGTLKNAVQLSCAKALLKDGASTPGGEITVTLHDLSFQVHSIASDLPREIDPRADWFQTDMHVTTREPAKFDSDETLQFVDIYDQVFHLIDEGRKMGLAGEELGQMVIRQIDRYFETLGSEYGAVNQGLLSLEHAISPKILPVAMKLISMAAIELERIYPQKTPILLAMHLEQYVSRARSGNLLLPPNIREMADRYRSETRFLGKHREWLSNHLNTGITDDEIGFLAAFLSQTVRNRWKPDVHITMISCSGNVAAGIVGYVRSLFGADHVYCVEKDAMLGVRKAFEMLCFDIKQHHGEKGNLIFTDCQQFCGTEEALYEATGIPCRVITLLEEHMAVIACRNTMTQQLSLEDMYHKTIADYREQMEWFFRRSEEGSAGTDADNVSPGEQVIFTICVTGFGSAEQMRKFLEQELREQVPSLRVVAVSSVDDVGAKAAAYGSDLKLIVGTVNPDIPGVPFILADTVFSPAGIDKIRNILTDWSMPSYIGWIHEEREEPASQTQINNFCVLAPSVDRETGTQCISEAIRILEREVYKNKLPDNIELRIFMHAASMLERIVNDSPLELLEEGQEEISCSEKWFAYLKEMLNRCFGAGGFPVSDAECFYFMLTLPETDEAFGQKE